MLLQSQAHCSPRVAVTRLSPHLFQNLSADPVTSTSGSSGSDSELNQSWAGMSWGGAALTGATKRQDERSRSSGLEKPSTAGSHMSWGPGGELAGAEVRPACPPAQLPHLRAG